MNQKIIFITILLFFSLFLLGCTASIEALDEATVTDNGDGTYNVTINGDIYQFDEVDMNGIDLTNLGCIQLMDNNYMCGLSDLNASSLGIPILQDANIVQFFGEMTQSSEGAPYSITVSAVDTEYHINGYSAGNLNHFTFSDSNLIPTYDGNYMIDYSISFNGGANNIYGIVINKNSIPQDDCHLERTIGTGGDTGNAGSTCLLELNAGDKITLTVHDETNPTSDIGVEHSTVRIFGVRNATELVEFIGDTTCDGISCNVTNTGTLDGFEGGDLVPYTGATTNVDLGLNSISADIGKFDTLTNVTGGGIVLGADIGGASAHSLDNMNNGTFNGTVQAEQFTSTDDITMQGHLLSLGASGADTVLSFIGTNTGAFTWMEDENWFTADAIDTPTIKDTQNIKLLAHYSFDDETITGENNEEKYYDLSGNNNHAYNTSTRPTTEFATGGAFDDGYLDFANDIVSIDGINSTSGDYTVVMWVRSSQTGTGAYLVDWEFGRFVIAWTTNSSNIWGISLGSGWKYFGATPNNDEWRKIVVTADSSTGELKGYIDGEQSGSTQTGYTAKELGGRTALGGIHARNSSFFVGDIGDFKIYEDVWTPEEVRVDYLKETQTRTLNTLKDFRHGITIGQDNAPTTLNMGYETKGTIEYDTKNEIFQVERPITMRNPHGELLLEGWEGAETEDPLYITDAGTGANNTMGVKRATFSSPNINSLEWNDLAIEVNPNNREMKVWLNDNYLGSGIIDATAWASLSDSFVIEFQAPNYSRDAHHTYKDFRMYKYSAGDDLIKMNSGNVRLYDGNIYVDRNDHIYIGNGTPTYPLEVDYNISGISAWFDGNVSASGYLTRTTVNTNPNVLETFNDGTELLNPDGTINHQAFGECFIEYPKTILERTDIITEIIQEEQYTTNFFDLQGNPITETQAQALEQQAEDNNLPTEGVFTWTTTIELIDVEYTTEVPVYQTIMEQGVDLTCENAKLRQAIAQINEAMNLEGDSVDLNVLFIEEIYTKSKVPIPEVNYCQMIMDANIYDKASHYAYREVRGKFVLDAEQRWVVLEGCEKQQLFEDCIEHNGKYSWCS